MFFRFGKVFFCVCVCVLFEDLGSASRRCGRVVSTVSRKEGKRILCSPCSSSLIFLFFSSSLSLKIKPCLSMKFYCLKQNSKSLNEEFQNICIGKRLKENMNSGYLDGGIINYFLLYILLHKNNFILRM